MGTGAAIPPEALARRVLRIGFGALWICDGLLQLQSAMPLGIPGGVLQPAAASSRGWIQAVVNFGVVIWEKHPVQAAAATVWIQLGIGAMLLVASRGRWSRLGGSCRRRLGARRLGVRRGIRRDIRTRVLSWLFGAPGSALLYVVAGALVALPERAWHDDRLGRRLVFGTGSFFFSWLCYRPGRGGVSGRGTSRPVQGRSRRWSPRWRRHPSRTPFRRPSRRSRASTSPTVGP